MINIKTISTAFGLSLVLLAGGTAVSANSNPTDETLPKSEVVSDSENLVVTDPSLKLEDLGKEITEDLSPLPRATLISQTITYDGQGYAYFTYRGDADMRFHIANNSSSHNMKWELKKPNGVLLLGSSTGPGKSYTFEFNASSLSDGQYQVYVDNGVGARSTFTVRAVTLE